MTDAERTKLLAKRAKLEKDILFLKSQPPAKSEAGRRLDHEAMLKLARQMVLIDQKLGRSVV